MTKKIKNTDYIYITAYIRTKENRLLNAERAERMINAKTLRDALKVLEECGYGEIGEGETSKLDKKLSEKRDGAMADIASALPDKEIIDIFRVKYDYHNAKTVIKSEAVGADPKELMSDSGRYAPGWFLAQYNRENFDAFSPYLGGALKSARDTLAKTGDSQLCDFILDSAFFKEYLILAQETGSEFFIGYAKLMIDSANLRSTVRAYRMRKPEESFLRKVLSEGGNISPDRIISGMAAGQSLAEIFSSLKAAAEKGAGAIDGGSLTEFEKACDDALTEYLKGVRYISFGPEAVFAYLCDIENELSAVRIIIAGKKAGLSPQTIKSRLRDFRN